MSVIRRLAGGRWFARVIVALISISLIGGAALALHSSQSASRRGTDARFASRATLATPTSWVPTPRNSRPGKRLSPPALWWTGPTAAFNANIAAFGFEDGSLLDSSARTRGVAPTPGLIGTDYGSHFVPLQRALLGYVVVFDVKRRAQQFHRPSGSPSPSTRQRGGGCSAARTDQ